ncbi:acyl-CoA dehydrogenase family protein [Streptomyces sp. VB1]|uniref:acyl-CoA dehydrogenase family protein n=1 Tax=Streptomyces sp. VB1 TaxID=2986803 RepID=UPI002241CF6E|nr:acyl-CoA dehydrogenase family protein [Streptomyces sp. VB1]UZI26837.1 acyl-CoA dehydrogenase family protein [Streptomyces sp. VB1]
MSTAPLVTGQAPHTLLRELLDEQARPGGAFDPVALRELDRDEAFPAEPCRVLDEFGLPAHYVPVAHGGRLDDLAELIRLVRGVARHDVTVAVAHAKTLLGAASVWVADDADQADALGRRIVDGQIVSWALTERGHGADLLAGELTAERTGAGWRLDGEKWLINNATRADQLCVLARTGKPGDARGFGLFLVDTHALAPGSHERLPKVRTHGIRGADISGTRLTGAIVPVSAQVGPDGAGLEIVLKALQLTRTVCTGLSLGACDHALSLAVRFAAQRRLYGRLLSELPRVRRILADAVADLLLMEAVSEVAGRAAHALPREMAVVSAVAKAYVPGTADALIAELGELLGVRAFFTEEYAEGRFAKLERDHRIVAIFDGSTDVNRHALVKQFPLLARAAARRAPDREGLAAAAALHTSLDPFAPRALTLAGNWGCSVLQAVPDAVARTREEIAAGTAPAALGRLLDAFAAACAELERELAEHRPTLEDVPAADFELARRYELCFAGAAALHVWSHRDAHAGPPSPLWAEGRWLRVCLARALGRLDRPAVAQQDAAEALVEELVRTEGRGMTLLSAR